MSDDKVTTVPVGPEPKWLPEQRDLDKHNNPPASPPAQKPAPVKW
jgi:hypothetical protein